MIGTIKRLATPAIVALTLAMTAVTLYQGWQRYTRIQLPADAEAINEAVVTIDGQPHKGSASAKVVVLEFTDYDCVFCRKHATSTFRDLDRDYVSPGLIRYVLMDFPLRGTSRRLAQFASCAGDQEKYWEMHNRIFRTVDVTSLRPKSLSESLKLDATKFQVCISSPKTVAAVNARMKEGTRLGVDATPIFFFGITEDSGKTVRLVTSLRGAAPYESFEKIIQDLLRKT